MRGKSFDKQNSFHLGKGDKFEMYVYYAKFNINSDLEEIKTDKKKFEKILSKLAHQLDVNSKSYEYVYEYEYDIDGDKVDEDGNKIKKKVIQREFYRIIKVKRLKEKHGDIIIGEMMREKPDAIEVYNDETHEIEKTGINKRAFSTLFVFDLQSETIAFTERRGIGRKQFIKAFEEISKEILTEKAIKVILKQDPRSFKEKVQELTRVNEMEVEIISPNFVDKELDEIEKEAKRIGEEMDKQNITKMQQHLQTSEENKKGIDINGAYAKELLEKYSVMSFLGYAKGKIVGFVGKSPKIVKSEEDTPLVTNIDYDERNNEQAFKDHILIGIKQEAVRKAITKERTKGSKKTGDELNE